MIQIVSKNAVREELQYLHPSHNSNVARLRRMFLVLAAPSHLTTFAQTPHLLHSNIHPLSIRGTSGPTRPLSLLVGEHPTLPPAKHILRARW